MNLRVSEPRRPERCYSHSAIKYTVKPGETMYEIASNFTMDVRDLMRYNRHIPNPRFLVTGDVLCIPKPWRLCSFLPPTKNTPKNSYALVSSLSGITCMASLPPVEELGEEYIGYFCYAVSEYDYEYVKLSNISKTPSIWIGTINSKSLEPNIKLIISADREKELSEPPGDFILFENT